LIHHYKVDKDGLVKSANLIIATGHNNIAMNKGVLQVAKHFIRGVDIKEGFLNRIEASIRCYDPCLSCSTHAMGKMPITLSIYNPDGKLVREISRMKRLIVAFGNSLRKDDGISFVLIDYIKNETQRYGFYFQTPDSAGRSTSLC